MSEDDFVLSLHFSSGFSAYNMRWEMIFLQNCKDVSPVRLLEVSSHLEVLHFCIWPRSHTPLNVFRVFYSYQAPRPPAMRRTHFFLPLFLAALAILSLPLSTSSGAHWTREKVPIWIILLPWHSWLWQLEGVVVFAVAQRAADIKPVPLNDSSWQLLTRSYSVGWILS